MLTAEGVKGKGKGRAGVRFQAGVDSLLKSSDAIGHLKHEGSQTTQKEPIMRVKRGVEFAVSLHNDPGSLAELINRLAATQINIKAFMLYTSFIMNIPDVPQVAGVCKMLVDNDEAARNAFRDLNIKFWEEEVLVLRAPDRPGLFATVLERLAEAGLNLKDGYATVPSGQEDALMVFSVSDVEKSLSIFSTANKVA